MFVYKFFWVKFDFVYAPENIFFVLFFLVRVSLSMKAINKLANR